MKLNELARELRFDKRIIEWGAHYGAITYSEYRKYLESLPDLSDDKEDITGSAQTVEGDTEKTIPHE